MWFVTIKKVLLEDITSIKLYGHQTSHETYIITVLRPIYYNICDSFKFKAIEVVLKEVAATESAEGTNNNI